jgi:antitoxin component YwqK of YwqJK toxin-antitoxin module
MNPEVEVSQVGDKKAVGHTAPPKLEFMPSDGDYRASLRRAAATLQESSRYSFHDLKLPDEKSLLGALKQISKDMKDQPEATAQLSNGELLNVKKKGGHITDAAIVRPDGSSDSAQFDDKLQAKSETLTTALGSSSRVYRLDGSLSTEENVVSGDGTAVYRDKLEFDGKGNIIHSHSETPSDSTDEARLPDGSGRREITHKDADPKKAFVDTKIAKPDGSVVEDLKFGNGDFKHLEADAQGVKRLDKSDVEKGIIDRQQRQPDGSMQQFRDLLI